VPVFQAMLENATRLCEAKFGGLLRYENGTLYPAATLNYPAAMAEFVRQRGPFLPVAGSALDRAFKTKGVIYVDDDAAEVIPTIASCPPSALIGQNGWIEEGRVFGSS